ncbi:hypothetical protein [uncultured Thiohalocapsa sp.]|uniref:hypothetical protein n=1 Tax=uncultured Thiohalocapsa sp. TaxID=768990 RepID=UPI0025F12A4E|nr:hypothetical protein [uncultured Thiohalocapsa sp.]
MPTASSQPGPDKLIALVERLILEQQRVEPLALLLAAGVLAHPDYEAWRSGHRQWLQDALQLPLADTLALLRRAGAQARAAGLVPTAAQNHRRGDDSAPLESGPSVELQRALATAYAPPPARRQLDLFYDSADGLLEQTLREAVLARRLPAAREALDKLQRRDPAYARGSDWRRLIDCLARAGHTPGAAPCRSKAAALLRDIDEITPVAGTLLGPQTWDCLVLLWAALAQAADGLRFDPAEPRLHASSALARLGRWQEARAAIMAEPGWRDLPDLLAPYVRACQHSGDARAARAALLASCWSHPHTAERILAAGDCPDSRLAAHWQAFCDLEPPTAAAAASAAMLATEDFPAWCLLVDPGLAADAPADATTDPHRAAAYGAAKALATAPDDLDQRRALGAAQPALLAIFLQRRRSAG